MKMKTHQNLQDAVKEMPKGQFTAQNAYIRQEKKCLKSIITAPSLRN